MRILHTSDWHLGKKLYEHSRMDEQRAICAEIVAIAEEEKADVVVVAGDLFDTPNPSAEAQELYYNTLKNLGRNGRLVLAIAGNHDSPERIEAALPLAVTNNIVLAGYPGAQWRSTETGDGIRLGNPFSGVVECHLPGIEYPLRALMVPYANESRMRTSLNSDGQDRLPDLRDMLESHWRAAADACMDDKGVNLMVAHLLFADDMAPEEPDGERSILYVGGVESIACTRVPEQVQYVAAGHIHKPMRLGMKKHVVYCGSPLACSVSEAGQQKQVVILDIEPGKKPELAYRHLKTARPLVRIESTSIDEACLMLAQQHQEAWVELTVTISEYLNSHDRKRLQEAHPGLIQIYPQLMAAALARGQQGAVPGLDLQDLDAIVKGFYTKKHGHEPPEKIARLLKQIIELPTTEEDIRQAAENMLATNLAKIK